MMNKEEQLMRKYHYGYIHSKKLLNEPYVKDLQQRIDKAIEYIKIYRSYENIDGKDYLKNRDEIGSLGLLQVDKLLEILGGKE